MKYAIISWEEFTRLGEAQLAAFRRASVEEVADSAIDRDGRLYPH